MANSQAAYADMGMRQPMHSYPPNLYPYQHPSPYYTSTSSYNMGPLIPTLQYPNESSRRSTAINILIDKIRTCEDDNVIKSIFNIVADYEKERNKLMNEFINQSTIQTFASMPTPVVSTPVVPASVSVPVPVPVSAPVPVVPASIPAPVVLAPIVSDIAVIKSLGETLVLPTPPKYPVEEKKDKRNIEEERKLKMLNEEKEINKSLVAEKRERIELGEKETTHLDIVLSGATLQKITYANVTSSNATSNSAPISNAPISNAPISNAPISNPTNYASWNNGYTTMIVYSRMNFPLDREGETQYINYVREAIKSEQVILSAGYNRIRNMMRDSKLVCVMTVEKNGKIFAYQFMSGFIGNVVDLGSKGPPFRYINDCINAKLTAIRVENLKVEIKKVDVDKMDTRVLGPNGAEVYEDWRPSRKMRNSSATYITKSGVNSADFMLVPTPPLTSIDDLKEFVSIHGVFVTNDRRNRR